MRFRRERPSEPTILEGTESSISDFGDSATEGFAEAWSGADNGAGDPGVLDGDDSAERSQLLESTLSGRIRARWIVLGILVIGAIAAAVWVWSSDDADRQAASQAEKLSFDDVLVGVDDVRPYAEGTQSVARARGVLDERFVVDDAGELIRVGPVAEPIIGFGLFVWGGRLHLAVDTSTVTSLNEACVVATLVADDLRPVDLAGHGDDCPEESTSTGDRLACLGEEVVVLELWPGPDRGPDRPTIEPAELRVRVEQPGTGESIRGRLDLSGGIASRLVEIVGQPGDAFDAEAAGLAGSCPLADRADVPVRFL